MRNPDFILHERINMKKILLLLLLLPGGISGIAQQATVTNIVPGAPKNADLRFPLVSLPDKAVARKINDYLQTTVLKQTTLKAPGASVFDKAKWTDKQGGFDQLGYTIHANNGKLLSITLDGDWLGTHPNPYNEYYVFNVQNGEIIFPGDIFTAQGLKELAGGVKRKRALMVAAYLKTSKNNREAAGDLENIKTDYTECNKDAQLETFSVTGTSIVFHTSPCLPHVMESLETNLDITYSFAQLQAWFSAFGQKLFGPGAEDISRDSFPSLSKPLHGKIDNKYGIVMQLHFNSAESVDGFYYYSNYQSAIDLSGTLKNGVLELKEHDNDDNDTAVFKGTVTGTTFTGTWTNLKTNKAIPFTVNN